MSQPILLGGLFIGVLSALPIVAAGNCCCLWIIGGGMLTAYLTQQNQAVPLSLGDGAVGGLLAGVTGAFVFMAVTIPIRLVTAPFEREMLQRAIDSAADIPPEVRELLQSLAQGSGIGGMMIGFIVMLIAGSVFSTLGGMLGALFFRRSTPPPPPVQPDLFGS